VLQHFSKESGDSRKGSNSEAIITAARIDLAATLFKYPGFGPLLKVEFLGFDFVGDFFIVSSERLCV
jgi:hypothetical protein